jgi:hypothetical protein
VHVTSYRVCPQSQTCRKARSFEKHLHKLIVRRCYASRPVRRHSRDCTRTLQEMRQRDSECCLQYSAYVKRDFILPTYPREFSYERAERERERRERPKTLHSLALYFSRVQSLAHGTGRDGIRIFSNTRNYAGTLISCQDSGAATTLR